MEWHTCQGPCHRTKRCSPENVSARAGLEPIKIQLKLVFLKMPIKCLSYLKASSQAVEQIEKVGDISKVAILNRQQHSVDELNDNGNDHKDDHQCVLLV